MAIVAICVLSVVYARSVRFHAKNFPTSTNNLVRSKGNPSAPVQIVEYLDYGCASCRLAEHLMDDYLKTYPSKLFWQVRYFPLLRHLYGLKSAIYSDCAAQQGKFWEFQNLLFEKQDQWSVLSNQTIDSTFQEYAKSLNLSIKTLNACVEDPHTKEKVLAEKETAKAAAVTQTPTFFINGHLVVGPHALAEELKKYFPEESKAVK